MQRIGKMLTGFLSWLLTLLTGPAVDKVLNHLERRAENETEREKVRTMATIEQIKLTLADRADQRRAMNEVRLATAGFWEMRLLTFLIAMPFLWHLWLVAFDTCWPQPWNVNAFPPPFDEWEGAILLSFFGVAVAGMGLKSIAGAIALNKR
jgi:hypothetical protein